MGSPSPFRLTNNAVANNGMLLGEPVANYKQNTLHAMFNALYEREAKNHKGPEWPATYKVSVVYYVAFDDMKFRYKIKEVVHMKQGEALNLIYSDGEFSVPIIAQDEMAAMARAVEILDKYAEEYNGR